MQEYHHRNIDRRTMLAQCGAGVGALALASLLADEGLLAGEAVGGKRGTAKHVIFLFMSGAPSQVDTFDPKPLLNELDGKDVPQSIAENVPRIKRSGLKNLMGSPFKFQQYGESGLPVSELLPHTA